MTGSGAFRSCFQCDDRYPGCHGSCEVYQKEKRAYESIRDRERERRKIEYDFAQDRIRRSRKK